MTAGGRGAAPNRESEENMATANNVEPLRARKANRIDCAPTGPGTPAGNYLRSFWQPVYHGADLAPGQAVPLRIMSVDYTLYRSAGGQVHLTQGRCPHRGTQLSTGWVEGDELRCFYHGWKFDAAGNCVEQPAEQSAFIDRISLQTWPAREYLGLVFAYLGTGEAPDFPRYPQFEQFRGLLEIDSYSRDCNYFQNLENALDMAHVGFVHGDNRASFEGIGLGKQLQAVESDWGITYTFQRGDGARRVQQFGMPNIFYMTALPNEPDVDWQESLFWWVPIDDARHMQFSLHRVPIRDEAMLRFKQRREQRRSEIDIAHQDLCEDILDGVARLQDADPRRVDLVRLQDDIAQIGQGRLADRDDERLGRSDIGVAVTRRIWTREMTAFLEGQPLKAWTQTADIVPRVWGLSGDAGEKAMGRAEPGHEAEIIDIRPFVEIQVQLKALHGAATRR